MRALVLAAGLGERLRPLTNTIPKPMIEIGARPLIHYPLMMLKQAGITEIAINVHYLADKIRTGLGDGHTLGVDITYAPEPVLLGTGGPLNGLRDFLGKGTFLIANSDTIVDIDLRAMIAAHRSKGALATIALFQPRDTERIEVDADRRIRRMRLLKSRTPVTYDDYPRYLPKDAGAVEAYMYCGVIVAESALFERIPPNPPWGIFTGLFAPMVAEGLAVFGFVHRGFFRTVDDLKTCEQLQREFALSMPPLSYRKD